MRIIQPQAEIVHNFLLFKTKDLLFSRPKSEPGVLIILFL